VRTALDDQSPDALRQLGRIVVRDAGRILAMQRRDNAHW
jgi:hypothetical protein